LVSPSLSSVGCFNTGGMLHEQKKEKKEKKKKEKEKKEKNPKLR